MTIPNENKAMSQKDSLAFRVLEGLRLEEGVGGCIWARWSLLKGHVVALLFFFGNNNCKKSWKRTGERGRGCHPVHVVA